MPRIITLYISDNADAQAILDKPPQGAVPIGLYVVPTQFCECTILAQKDGYLLNKQFARSKKYGWYLHRTCSKPGRGHIQYPKNQLVEEGFRVVSKMGMTIRFPYDPADPSYKY
jgi:hypothetical protein